MQIYLFAMFSPYTALQKRNLSYHSASVCVEYLLCSVCGLLFFVCLFLFFLSSVTLFTTRDGG